MIFVVGILLVSLAVAQVWPLCSKSPCHPWGRCRVNVKMISAHRAQQDILLRKQIANLEATFPSRFRHSYVLSAEAGGLFEHLKRISSSHHLWGVSVMLWCAVRMVSSERLWTPCSCYHSGQNEAEKPKVQLGHSKSPWFESSQVPSYRQYTCA